MGLCSFYCYDSLIPSSPGQQLQLDNLQNQPYGYILLLDEPPATVNVVVHHKTTTSAVINSKIDRINQHLHSRAVAVTNDGDPVVPIFPSSDSKNRYARSLYVKRKPFTIPGKTGMYKVSKVTIHQTFPFTLGFAMTVFKAQGQTLPAVVLCLSQRLNHVQQMSLSAIYVAMSRVQKAVDIRLLPHGVGNSAMYYEYMNSLTLSPYIPSFFHGFHGLESWNGTLAYEHYKNTKTV